MRIRAVPLLLLAALLAAASPAGVAGRDSAPADVVGTYSYSHPYGFVSVTLEKDGSYASEVGTCTEYYNSKGTYTVKGGVVETVLESTTRRAHDGSNAETIFPAKDARESAGKEVTRYQSVRWGERLYLVREGDLLSFCNAVNTGGEPRKRWDEDPAYLAGRPEFGSFLLRDGDEKKGAAGLPQLPERWQEYLLKKPVKGVVLSLDGDDRAMISVGGREGLKEGMVLGVVGGRAPSMWSGLKVVSVGETTARVLVGDEVVVGSKVSTRYEPPKLVE